MEQLPLLGMGTWGMGGTFEKDTRNDDESIIALRSGINLGITLIDTAEFYGAGHTEELIAEAIQPYPRESIKIISKVWKTNLHYDAVLDAAERSLARLKTDYIDLYMIHWPSDEVPLDETMSAMERLVNEGKVRTIGVSNFSTELIEEAQRSLINTRLTANQIEYNLTNQNEQYATIPYCKQYGLQVIAYRPFAKGSLTRVKSDMILRISEKYNKTPNQIALNWLISQDIIAIPKASSLEHMKENAGSLGWALSKEDIDLLRTAFSSKTFP